MRRTIFAILVLIGLSAPIGCTFQWPGSNKQALIPPTVQLVRLSDPLRPEVVDGPISLHGARNETVGFAVQVNRFPGVGLRSRITLRLKTFTSSQGTIPPSAWSAWQVLPVPVNTNHAGYVRHTAQGVADQRAPRALLPLSVADGVVDLTRARSPDTPLDAESHPKDADSTRPMLWIDLAIPPAVPAGEYQASFELVDGRRVLGTVPVRLIVDDFVLPDQPRLQMVAAIEWDSLVRLFPQQFRGATPNLVSRSDPKLAGAVKVLDDLVRLAHANRAVAVVPRLQPLVKWFSGRPPQVDWSDFDALVGPWLTGSGLPGNVPLGYWPLPEIDAMARLDAGSRLEYWQAVAAHFDQLDWISRSSIELTHLGDGPIPLMESAQLSDRAAILLGAHPSVRVSVPLEEEQISVSSDQSPRGIPAANLSRLLYAAPGLVSMPPLQRLPENAAGRWLRAGRDSTVPYVGAAVDERETRMWAWLAFLRDAQRIQWPAALPNQNDAKTVAEIDEPAWFYPGSWFGIDTPLPTLQLKWMRRAQQDYEYLHLAKQRGQSTRAATLARLITRPVELQPTQPRDAAYGLLSGTSDAKTWDDVMSLLSRTILISQPGQAVDPAAERQLSYDVTAWIQTQSRPLLLARRTDWALGIRDAQNRDWLNLSVAMDIYNAAEAAPERNGLGWALAPDAWAPPTTPADVDKLGTCQITRGSLDTRIDLDKITAATRRPARIVFLDGHSRRPYLLDIVAPAAWSEKRTGAAPQLDGSLDDWVQEDALHVGPLVEMLSRPLLQHQELRFASTNSAIYSTWTSGTFYIGFKVDSVDGGPANASTSYIRREFRRAWGEDLCEILIQPVYADNTLGPLLYIASKPRGQLAVYRRLDSRLNAKPWQAFSSSDILYAATLEQAIWRGEIAIPWEAMADPANPGKRPVLLRFNFSQHHGTSGQSASWAGPVDHGRDDDFTGILQLRPMPK